MTAYYTLEFYSITELRLLHILQIFTQYVNVIRNVTEAKSKFNFCNLTAYA